MWFFSQFDVIFINCEDCKWFYINVMFNNVRRHLEITSWITWDLKKKPKTSKILNPIHPLMFIYKILSLIVREWFFLTDYRCKILLEVLVCCKLNHRSWSHVLWVKLSLIKKICLSHIFFFQVDIVHGGRMYCMQCLKKWEASQRLKRLKLINYIL